MSRQQSSRAGLAARLLLVVAAAACTPASLQRGKDHLVQKNYEKAITELEAADREKPNDETIQAALKDARRSAAEGAFTRSMQRAPEDLWARYGDLDTALGFDARNPMLKAAIADLETRQRDLQRTVEEVFVSLNKNDPGVAFASFQKLKPYVPWHEGLKNADVAVSGEFASFHVTAGRADLEAGRLAEASTHYKAATTAVPTDAKARAGLRTIEGIARLEAKDFEPAMAAFTEALKLDPQFAFARGRLTAARRGLLARYLETGLEGFASAQEPAEVMKAMEPYLAAVAVGLDEDPERTDAEQRLTALRQRLAGHFVRIAGEAISAEPAPLPATALVAYRAAHELDPEGAKVLEPFAAKALALFQNRLRLRVFVHAQDDGLQVGGLDVLAHQGLLTAVDAARVARLEVVTRELQQGLLLNERRVAQDASDIPGLADSDLVVLGRMTGAKLTDNGRDTPLVKSSKYVSRMQMVHNPEYETAEARVERARAAMENEEVRYQQQKAANEQAAANAKGTGVWGAILVGAVAGLNEGLLISAKSDYQKAQTAFANTPREIEEKVIDPYEYEEFHVTVEAQLDVELKLITRAGAAIQAETINAKVTREGTALQGVHEQDTLGLKNKDGPLPDPEVVRAEAEQQLVRMLTDKVGGALRKFSVTRFAIAAKAAKEQKNEAEALENAVLHLETTAGEDADAAELEALAFGQAFLSRGNRKLSRYRSPAATNDGWPRAAVAGKNQR